MPGGMYGHESVTKLPVPDSYPQFMSRGRGAHVWDVDGNEYIDLMCSYGPVVLGHQHPKVEAAVRAQEAKGECQNGPSARMVELAEAWSVESDTPIGRCSPRTVATQPRSP